MFSVEGSAVLCCVLAQTHQLSWLCSSFVYWSLPSFLLESMSWFVPGTRLLARLDLVVRVHVSTGGCTGFSGCPVDFVVALCGYKRLVNIGGGHCTAVMCGNLCGSANEVRVSFCLQVWSGMSAVLGMDLAARLLLFAEGSSLSGLTTLRSRWFVETLVSSSHGQCPTACKRLQILDCCTRGHCRILRFLVSHFLLILRWLMTAADIVEFSFLTMVYLL